MPTIPIKIDTGCTNIFDISSKECIGDSLSTVNYNMTSLDITTCNHILSGNTSWNPWVTTVRGASSDWESVYSLVNTNSGSWESARATVNTLSAGFTNPITVIYPLAVANASSDLRTISAWVTSNFVDTSYSDNQLFYVYTFEYATTTHSKVRYPKLDVEPEDREITFRCRMDCDGCYTDYGTDHTAGCGTYWSGDCDCSTPIKTRGLACGDSKSDVDGWTTYTCPDLEDQSVMFTNSWDDQYINRVHGLEIKLISGTWVHIRNLTSFADCWS